MFQIGDIVKFKYTGMEAEIVADHRDGSYTVWTEEDDDESIAFEDDIVLAADFKNIVASEQQKDMASLQGNKGKKKTKGPSTEDLFYSKSELEQKTRDALLPDHLKKAKIQKKSNLPKETSEIFIPTPIIASAPSQAGCYLAFYPTSPTNYTIYLVNDSLTSFGFEFKLFLKKELVHGFNKIIPVNTFFPIGEFLHEQFNDSPHIEFSCPKFNFEKSIKLKYRKFAATQQTIPLMGLSTYGFLLFQKLNPYAKQGNGSIKDYTKQHKSDKAFLQAPAHQLYQSFGLMDIASFENEVDLHAEKLVNDTSEFSNKELFELQLDILDNYITKAAELGLKEVFVIHGLGKGTLKQGVDDYLRYHGDVKSFKNEFHEKYAWGATRVIFK